MQIKNFYLFLIFALVSSNAICKETNKPINYLIKVPTIVGNGAVVPVSIVFDPPLSKGNFFTLLFNNAEVAKITVQEGQLIEFSTRLKMSNEIVTTSVQCPNCIGENPISEVQLTAPLSITNSIPEKILLNSKPGLIRALVTNQSTTNGTFNLKSNGLIVNVSLARNTVTNPFFYFRGSVQRGEACATYQSSGKISECITVEKDAPKDSGKQILVCELMVGRSLRSNELEIDYNLGTINGHAAEITDSEIRWSGDTTESVLSRVTGEQKIISLVDNEHFRKGQVIITGKCQPAQNKPAAKLF